MATPRREGYEWLDLRSFGGPDGFVYARRWDMPVMRVYQRDLDGPWVVEPWSGAPPGQPLTFAFLQDAKTYCEVTTKLTDRP